MSDICNTCLKRAIDMGTMKIKFGQYVSCYYRFQNSTEESMILKDKKINLHYSEGQ